MIETGSGQPGAPSGGAASTSESQSRAPRGTAQADGGTPYALAISGGVATWTTCTCGGTVSAIAGSMSAWTTSTLALESRSTCAASAALKCQFIGTA